MPEITVEIDADQASTLRSLIGKSVIIEAATVEAMHFGAATVKLTITEKLESQP